MVHRVGQLDLLIREEVPVTVDGYLNGGMTKEPADRNDMHTFMDEERRARVTQVVESKVRQFVGERSADGWLEVSTVEVAVT